MANSSVAEVNSVPASQHQELVRLMPRSRGARPSRAGAFARFLGFLALHEAAEDECLHQPAKEVVGDGAGMVDERVREEALAGQAIAVLEDLGDPAHSAEFAARFDELCRALMEHADAEQHEEIPRLAGVLSADDCTRAVGALALVPELTPEHARSGMRFEQLLAAAHDYFRVTARV